MGITAIIIGGFLFLSVSLGTALALMFSRLLKIQNSGIFLICGGFLVSLLFIDILPSSFKEYEHVGLMLGLIWGYIIFLIIHQLLENSSPKQNNSVHLLALAMFIHTIPISITIGTVIHDSILTSAFITATILHHIPEGFALTLVMVAKGKKIFKLYLYFFVCSIIFIGFMMLGQFNLFSIRLNTILMGISIGLIASTSIKEFIINRTDDLPIKQSITYTTIGIGVSLLFQLLL
ncbi:ZIP family metal transporter [Alkalihalophilus marmarensis]|uniref:zinc transporter family protein n=1 Tax=Alkalihalophilus marmarensis TaxID=521377 RepID=UPI002DB822D3|nr:zinc transporter family protein [Alkalihalophilus marmarensis]MEC2074393.1 zinc transporter family protein [Alkalihalophilus marmarensis]